VRAFVLPLVPVVFLLFQQVDAGFYGTFSYIFSVVMMHLPLACIEVFVFSTILYFMSSFTDDPARWSADPTHSTRLRQSRHARARSESKQALTHFVSDLSFCFLFFLLRTLVARPSL